MRNSVALIFSPPPPTPHPFYTQTIRYYNPETKGLNLEGMIEEMKKADKQGLLLPAARVREHPYRCRSLRGAVAEYIPSAMKERSTSPTSTRGVPGIRLGRLHEGRALLLERWPRARVLTVVRKEHGALRAGCRALRPGL
jgi:hypothetical protein